MKTANSRIYLDHNATSPLMPSVQSLVPHWLNLYGNPSSIHWAGRGPKTLLRESRQKVAHLIGAEPLEVIFTSGGSEANNLVLKGIHYYNQKHGINKNHYIISAVEHPSILETARFLKETLGAEVEILPAPGGIIDVEDFKKRLRSDTALVSVMLASNETGTLFPIKKLAKIAHEKGVLFHTDAVQALGKMPLSVKDLGVDFASFAGHKFYALKGAGVLYAKRGSILEPLIHGGGQERHRRAGTENLLAIASMGHVAEFKEAIIEKSEAMRSLRDHFEIRIVREMAGVRVVAGETSRLSNTSCLVIEGVEGETLLMNLDLEGFAVSTGSACSSGSPEPSHVLLAMGLSREQAQSSLRVSLGWETTAAHVDLFISTLKSVVDRIRSFGRPILVPDVSTEAFLKPVGL